MDITCILLIGTYKNPIPTIRTGMKIACLFDAKGYKNRPLNKPKGSISGLKAAAERTAAAEF